MIARDEARAQILLSGAGDFASLAEAAGKVLVEIENRWSKPDSELAPRDGVWLANMASGNRLADELAHDGRVAGS